LRDGRWQSTIGFGLRGRTLGIYGYGKLGSMVAKIGIAFGMDVLAFGREASLERATAERDRMC
jgi:D-3-phosphoglycerate dehydrogenase